MQILRLRDVAVKLGTSTRSIYNYIDGAGFPKPIKLGLKTAGWVESEVDSWLKARIDARDAELQSGAAK